LASDAPREGRLKRAALFPLRKHGDSGRRFHLAVAITGVALCAGGLLAYGLVAPEIPFAEAPVRFQADLHAEDTAKIFGRIDCTCYKAIDRTETPAGATGKLWNATYEPFYVVDPSGKIPIDTDSVTRLNPGPTGGDYVINDNITVYGTVYDQGNGALVMRASMIAKSPTDTPAIYAFWALLVAAVGALAIAYLLTDRLVFGSPEP